MPTIPPGITAWYPGGGTAGSCPCCIWFQPDCSPAVALAASAAPGEPATTAAPSVASDPALPAGAVWDSSAAFEGSEAAACGRGAGSFPAPPGSPSIPAPTPSRAPPQPHSCLQLTRSLLCPWSASWPVAHAEGLFAVHSTYTKGRASLHHTCRHREAQRPAPSVLPPTTGPPVTPSRSDGDALTHGLPLALHYQPPPGAQGRVMRRRKVWAVGIATQRYSRSVQPGASPRLQPPSPLRPAIGAQEAGKSTTRAPDNTTTSTVLESQ